jgi:hypothetical protein
MERFELPLERRYRLIAGPAQMATYAYPATLCHLPAELVTIALMAKRSCRAPSAHITRCQHSLMWRLVKFAHLATNVAMLLLVHWLRTRVQSASTVSMEPSQQRHVQSRHSGIQPVPTRQANALHASVAAFVPMQACSAVSFALQRLTVRQEASTPLRAPLGGTAQEGRMSLGNALRLTTAHPTRQCLRCARYTGIAQLEVPCHSRAHQACGRYQIHPT